MQSSLIDQILKAVKVSAVHPLFSSRIYALVTKNQNKILQTTLLDQIKTVLIQDFFEISSQIDRASIQESCSVRNVLRTRQLANLLINDAGEIQIQVMQTALVFLKQHLYSLGVDRHYDAKRQEHIARVLEQLLTDKTLLFQLKKISRPLSNLWAEELIRYTLDLQPQTALTDAHAQRAVLCSWLTYLRQNVGSCFATAPAILVQAEQPSLFLQDLSDLIATGRLKRTFAGIEYSVPLSTSWGSGDLKKPLVVNILTETVKPEIWYSPALIASLDLAAVFPVDWTNKQKVLLLKKWIEDIARQMAFPYHLCILTVETILRILILKHLNLTEQQIKDFESRPKLMIQSHLMVQVNSQSKTGVGIGERCARFFALFEQVKNRFMAFSDQALLKAWEFTLASFSETKSDFNHWNLYASLGMGSNDTGGIGQVIYQVIAQKLEQTNSQIKEFGYQYEMLYTQVKTLETRMQHTSTEQELQWIKMDYRGRASELYVVQNQLETAQAHANALVAVYDNLYKLYMNYFKDYFQEVYDADMQEVTTGPFDDSPAGFRLLYKYGRSQTSQWARIKNLTEYVDALAAFFAATENQVTHVFEESVVYKDISDVITAIIIHVKTKEFLESAIDRMAAAHRMPLIKNPLEHLDKIEKKPWAYTSGGTMTTLIATYYRLEDSPKLTEKWVENELELLVFIADTLKSIPAGLINPFLTHKRFRLLIQSPTHAFLLQPMNNPFKECWLNDEFTYTYIRDQFIRPAESFVENLLLTHEMIQYLISQLALKIPENFQPRFKSYFQTLKGPLSPLFFREMISDGLMTDRGLYDGSRRILDTDEIDSLLFSMLPLFPARDLKPKLHAIFNQLPQLSQKQINAMLDLLEKSPFHVNGHQILHAQQLQHICKALLCLNFGQTTSAIDYALAISLAAQKLGFAMPTPIIFADTNWVKDEFGFTVNPGNGRLELWRMDYTGSNGYPMSSWKQWVNGSRTDLKWGIYVNPIQYGQN